jgi:energy-coupling factor transporter ATP-binding protein EcfA2
MPMKAFEINNICPYTGLRSFTEEESLYFKGRDHQIDQITDLLEQNKFLMVTGASGEGKSSLIYAGLIPNARAGFFKAKYTNWMVADFRPERSPVENMASSISTALSMNQHTVETEIKRGFSSLIDLYTNSGYYIDESDAAWQALDDNSKRDKKREAANLIILVDQFEEFFTNPENFFNEAPSQEAQIVVNLLLETARISISKNLPVYVVCTMRSDYIGQCSAFRGLPEYIGFSQFFVPRLKRNDLKQVIEEPAILSGNRISQRLVERLVFDISEGVDQLPILQHALSQIWKAAANGSEEMDLIHYAMAGGMPANELPDDDQKNFVKWFKSLPDHQRKYYHQTGLNRVIEIHASTLYENAASIYNEKWPQSPISDDEAKWIISQSFTCLTKIDNSRAVRNRMTLSEITEIINSPGITEKVVGELLNVFREEGNSFIRPFKTADPATESLKEDSVLDITHESLIRNWGLLTQWAEKEFDYYATYLDFKIQLDRWKKNDKSSAYYLPIGPLTYFENWFNDRKPNIGWIKRYSEIFTDKQEANRNAELILEETREFLKRSASKVMVTRAFMKYGPTRIATITAILVMLILSGFYLYDAGQKADKVVLEKVRSESRELLNSSEIPLTLKAQYLVLEEVHESGFMLSYLNSLPYQERLSLANEVLFYAHFTGKDPKVALAETTFDYIFETLGNAPENTPKDFLIEQSNKFLVLLFSENYFKPSEKLEKQIDAQTKRGLELAKEFYKDPSLFRPLLSSEINLSLQYWLTAGNAGDNEIDSVLALISPLLSEQAAAVFDVYYPKEGIEGNGRQGSNFYNGFHTLASLYAAKGNFDEVKWVFSEILRHDRNYFELGRLFNNHQNIIAYFYQYGFPSLAKATAKWVSTNTEDNPEITIYRNMVVRSGYQSHLYNGANVVKNLRSYRGYIFPNLFYSARYVNEVINKDYEQLLEAIPDANERNFQLAMQNKRRAIFEHKYAYDRKLDVDKDKLNQRFKNAIELYRKIDKDYLNANISVTTLYYTDGVRTYDNSRKNLFIYPDYADGWFSLTYHSDVFFNFLYQNNLLGELYTNGADLKNLHIWVSRAFHYNPFVPPNLSENDFPLPNETLENLLSFINTHPARNEFNPNILYTVLANRYFDLGEHEKGLSYFEKLDQSAITRSSDMYEYLEKIFFLNSVNELSRNLASIGKAKEAINLNENIENDIFKSWNYSLMADRVYAENASPIAFTYLDSSLSKVKNIDLNIVPYAHDMRRVQIRTISRIGGQGMNKITRNISRNVDEARKGQTSQAQVYGIANEGNFFLAHSLIPKTNTDTEDLASRTFIMIESLRKREDKKNDPVLNWIIKFLEWGDNYIPYIIV